MAIIANQSPPARVVHFVDESGGAWPWRRQLEVNGPNARGTHYYFDMADHAQADWLVVFSAWPQTDFFTSIPRERRIFVAGEPESFHKYMPQFLDQFGTVLTTQSTCQHENTIRSQVGINWFAGVAFQNEGGRFSSSLEFSDFRKGNPAKTRLCSVVCSNQSVTQGHRDRLAFVERLKAEFGDQLDYYGRGSRPMPDKDEALASYKFHIALENSRHKDYWTEKLADPFLRGCHPIYSGCTNVLDYFPEKSLSIIDINRPEESIAAIRTILRRELDAQVLESMEEAKRRVLYEYNVFSILDGIYRDSKFSNVLLDPLPRPEQLFSEHEIKNRKFSRRLRKYVRNLFS